MSILYPIASSAEMALAAPRGRAARERDAERLAGQSVRFVREFTGPVFRSEAIALDVHAGRIDDPRPDHRRTVPPEDRYCELKPIADRTAAPDSRIAVWRLSVAYWRTGAAPEGLDMEQARKARRAPQTEALDAAALDALTRQPLRPMRPQQPLDVGLFEFRPPDAPHIIMPDE